MGCGNVRIAPHGGARIGGIGGVGHPVPPTGPVLYRPRKQTSYIWEADHIAWARSALVTEALYFLPETDTVAAILDHTNIGTGTATTMQQTRLANGTPRLPDGF